MGDEEKKSLEIRLASIESKLSRLMQNIQPVEEMKAAKADIDTYLSVLRAALAADWGEMCGINDCAKCIITCRICGGGTLCRVCFQCVLCYQCIQCVQCLPYMEGIEPQPCISTSAYRRRLRGFESLGR